MDNVYLYLVDMPPKIKEAVIPCYDGYTVYIDRNLCEDARLKALAHALDHIFNDDFHKQSVQDIEWKTHKGENYG